MKPNLPTYIFAARLANYLVRKFSVMLLYASQGTSTQDFLPLIFSVSAFSNVPRIEARRIVARVKSKRFRPSSMNQPKCYTMGEHSLLLSVSVKADPTITISINGERPQQTFIRIMVCDGSSKPIRLRAIL